MEEKPIENGIDIFRANVEARMEDLGLNKMQLAQGAGVPPDKLYKFFQRKGRSFDAVEAGKVAAYLGTTVDILLGKHNPKAMRTMALLDQLGDLEQEIVLRQIEALAVRRQD
tara:strand:- start:389 stop:724 length:336 start_codon:yes stop_codon:yes gene_type:complete